MFRESFIDRALTMVRFVGKGHLNDQTKFITQILVRHMPIKSDISMKVRYFRIFFLITYKYLAMQLRVLLKWFATWLVLLGELITQLLYPSSSHRYSKRRYKQVLLRTIGYKSQIFGSDFSLLLSLKVVRFRSDFWKNESDMICKRPAYVWTFGSVNNTMKYIAH